METREANKWEFLNTSRAKGSEKGCGGEYLENIRSGDSGMFLRVPKRRGDMPVQERSSGIRSHHPFPLSLGCLFTFPFEHISLWLWETYNPPALSKKYVAVAQTEIETRFLPPSLLLYHLQIRPSLNLSRKARQKPTVYQQSACITSTPWQGCFVPLTPFP